MPKNITVFTTNTCAYCGMVKKWLKNKGFNFNEVNLNDNPEQQAEATRVSGQMSVPITLVTNQDDSQSVVVGFNLRSLAAAVA